MPVNRPNPATQILATSQLRPENLLIIHTSLQRCFLWTRYFLKPSLRDTTLFLVSEGLVYQVLEQLDTIV